ncbi:P-loop containing nucleoside triphosphate hydrolase protein [Cyathus striatus]|nr:P-loop containing nucleoside triphosphate hydrolase protein [Cyathus striatus]
MSSSAPLQKMSLVAIPSRIMLKIPAPAHTDNSPHSLLPRHHNQPNKLTLIVHRSSYITPKHPGSISSISSVSDLSNCLSRTGNRSSLNTTHKMYKVSLSVESRKTVKSNLSTSKSLSPVPVEENLRLLPATSEMDVSNVDPEQVLVDYQTVDPGDVLFDTEDHLVEADKADDKVMVSVYVRPSSNPSAWSPSTNEISLLPAYHKNTTLALTFTFDSILTGSENKPIFIATSRKHVRAAMEGYNAVVFAYGQTASGKMYKLTGDENEPGIVPRATRDILSFISNTPEREYLRCSYLEIYNETIINLLTPPLLASANPCHNGRQTAGLDGTRLQARGGRSVRTSILSLIDLAGSEKATSDKERTREGKYMNTSLLIPGTVIGTLAENAARGKTDHVPYCNLKLTRILQPSLSGNARISVIRTINPDTSAVTESTSTLLFAKRVKGVHLNAQKKEIVDTDALIERYRKEIEDLNRRLAEREPDAPVRNRGLLAREQIDGMNAMGDLNGRIKQLTKLILTN